MNVVVFCRGVKFFTSLQVTKSTSYEKRKIFIDLAKNYNINFYDSKTLQNAVNLINEKHDINSVALLSPACASLDQFKNYKQRGEIFKEFIENLS